VCACEHAITHVHKYETCRYLQDHEYIDSCANVDNCENVCMWGKWDSWKDHDKYSEICDEYMLHIYSLCSYIITMNIESCANVDNRENVDCWENHDKLRGNMCCHYHQDHYAHIETTHLLCGWYNVAQRYWMPYLCCSLTAKEPCN